MVRRVGSLDAGAKLGTAGISRQQNADGFKRVLDKELGKLKFSAHAQERIESRNIRLSAADMLRLENATSLAAAKGAREALLVLDDLGFIVSVENRTVITAVERSQMKGNVFTNIDSTVIV